MTSTSGELKVNRWADLPTPDQSGKKKPKKAKPLPRETLRIIAILHEHHIARQVVMGISEEEARNKWGGLSKIAASGS